MNKVAVDTTIDVRNSFISDLFPVAFGDVKNRVAATVGVTGVRIESVDAAVVGATASFGAVNPLTFAWVYNDAVQLFGQLHQISPSLRC
jgi:hypothetical protein